MTSTEALAFLRAQVEEAQTRFWEKVAAPNERGCRLWTASVDGKGYGQFWLSGHMVGAHRYAYGLIHGPLAAGAELDHLCRVRTCVNPDHLEAVAHVVNVRRGESPSAKNAKKTHCFKGHPIDILLKSGGRACRTCKRAYQRKPLTAEQRSRKAAREALRRRERALVSAAEALKGK